jgi:hypothetical protein
MKFGSFEGFKKKSAETAVTKPEIPPEKPAALGEWDRTIIEKGLTYVVTEMYRDFGNTLPDAIILPDTSARPLMWALKPSFDQLSKQGIATSPRIYFFKSIRPEVGLSIEEDSFKQQISSKEEYIELKKEARERERSARGDSYDDRWEDSDEDIVNRAEEMKPEEMKRARDTMQARAEEILQIENERLGHKARIAVIDEYATEDALTMQELRSAFHNDELPFYTVFAQPNRYVKTGQEIKSSIGLWIESFLSTYGRSWRHKRRRR